MSLTRIIGVAVAASVSLAQSTTQEPCAQVSSIQYDTALNAPVYVPASLANDCLLSAPLVEDDAVAILDGLVAMLEWQSSRAWLENPPSDYPWPAVNLVNELQQLRGQISSGSMGSEIEFERNLTRILNRAHDGHLYYFMDGMGVFQFTNGFGSLDVVAIDGQNTAGLYLHDEMIAWQGGNASEPSAISSINGVDAATFVMQLSQNESWSLFQDPDALFNAYMYSTTDGFTGGPSDGLFARVGGFYSADNTTISFANGTTASQQNLARVQKSFNGEVKVIDGPTFSLAFCNATQKIFATGPNRAILGSSISGQTHGMIEPVRAATVQDVSQLQDYPPPVVISSDGSVSGYFLEGTGFEDVAVLVLTKMTESDVSGAQYAMTDFLNTCRSQNKKYLVLDITSNTGGTINLAYDFFKQLFPDIEPYGAGQWRSHDAYNIIGNSVTTHVQQIQQSASDNLAGYANQGLGSIFDATAYLNDSGTLFSSWNELYGPVNARKDNFTNLFRWNIENPEFTEQLSGITITGYGDRAAAPQPFASENIIIVGNGMCQSSCTIFSHLLKWQAKVKSIAVGGRPQTGPMQSQGGVKGSQIISVPALRNLASTYLQASNVSTETLALLNDTSWGVLTASATTMIYRTSSAGSNGLELTFNSQNNIAEGDASYTPLQFVYEAADCKMWNRPQHVYDIQNKWTDTAANAFGLNGTSIFSGCVADSTQHPSSLSGNSTLFNGGVPNNVTVFINAGTNAIEGSETSSSSGGGGPSGGSGSTSDSDSKNSAGRLRIHDALVLIVAAVAGLIV